MDIKLEEVYDFEDTLPICIIDLRVVLFDVLASYHTYSARLQLHPELRELWYTCKWACLFNNPMPWLANQPAKGFNVIVVDDAKHNVHGNYWRNEYLMNRNFPRYKGNRNWEDRPDGYNELHAAALAYLMQPDCPIPIFREFGFEADDWAGVSYRLKRPSTQPMILLTVDTDWMQLVDDTKNILFASTRHHYPRLRSEYEALMWAKKKGHLIDRPIDIIDIKQKYGDSADNLIPGSPREVIDLIDPPIKPNTEAVPIMKKAMARPTSNTSAKHLKEATNWLIQNCLG